MDNRKRALTESDLRRSNLPQSFWTTRVDKLPPDGDTRERLCSYMRRIDTHIADGVGMLLTGDTGVGKTSAASLVLRQARSLRHSTLFLTISELRDAVRATQAYEDGLTVAERAKQVELLVLDGLRKEDAATPFVGAQYIEELAALRVQWLRPTVITTALDAAALRNDFGGLMAKMLGKWVHIHMVGPNRRREEDARLRRSL